MDAQYLKKNVNEALIEALASMAIVMPDDGIEYIGKYLIQYVQRQEMKKIVTKKNEEIDALAKQSRDAEVLKEVAFSDKESKKRDRESKLKSFLDSLLPLSKTKQDVMNRTTQFLTEYLNIPAAYIAIVKVVGETESLNYYGASPGQEHCLGKKIIKQVEESEEVPPRMGLSFDAFKLPEIPEPEEEELAEGEEPKPKIIPKPSPIHIENVMRNSRIKFFGIPKLGAYVAIPLEYASLDHENGCQLQTNEETGETSYIPSPINVKLIIGMDTIGKYRRFEQNEIEIAQTVGNCLVNAFLKIEERMYDNNLKCINTLKPVVPHITESIEGLKSAEEEAVSSALSELSDEEKGELGPIKDVSTRAVFWTQQIINAPIINGYSVLKDYILPVPNIVSMLFYCVGSLIGINQKDMKDLCGDISWDAIKQTILSSLITGAFTYNIQAVQTVTIDNSIATIRNLCDTNSVFDHSQYVQHFSGLVPISIWLQKNLNAREQIINYFKDVKNEQLEIIVRK